MIKTSRRITKSSVYIKDYKNISVKSEYFMFKNLKKVIIKGIIMENGIFIYKEAFEDNLIKKVILKANGDIYIEELAFTLNYIDPLIIKGKPQKIYIGEKSFSYNCIPKLEIIARDEIIIKEKAFDYNKIKKIKLVSNDSINIQQGAFYRNPIETLYLNAPKINLFGDKSIFYPKNLKTIYIRKEFYKENFDKYFKDINEKIKIKFII